MAGSKLYNIGPKIIQNHLYSTRNNYKKCMKSRESVLYLCNARHKDLGKTYKSDRFRDFLFLPQKIPIKNIITFSTFLWPVP